jgi:quinoprotein glucose dehydrogenase
MWRTAVRALPDLALCAMAIVFVFATAAGQSRPRPSTRNGDWPHYNADLKGTRYSPLDQINGSNFNRLEVAWRFKTDSLGPRPEYKLEGTPLAINGVLYTTAGTRRSVIALDGKTGELMWAHSLREGRRAAVSPRQLSGHGVAYWTDGGSDNRVIYVTTGYQLVSLQARDGSPVRSFGNDGIVDLKVGVVKGVDQPIDLESGEIGVHSTAAVTNDVIIVGSAMREGATVSTHNNTKGLVRDYYGGHRPGNNLFAESLVCVDLKTGRRKWHFQLVHHPIWNFDNSSAPILLDITVDGRPIKAVALPSKLGWVYVFDRVTGQPVWPIEERPVPQSDVPGEKTSPTQPFPTKPPRYARNFINIPDEVIDFTPQLRAEAFELLKRYKTAPNPFVPPILGDVNGVLGAIGAGTATNWPGSAADPETRIVYAQAGNNAVQSRSLVAPPPGFSDIRYVQGIAGQPFVEVLGPGDCCAADAPPRRDGADAAADAGARPPTAPVGAGGGLQVQGLPTFKPPYGVLSAVDINKGEILWQVPHGDTPDNVRNHPALKGLTIPKTGRSIRGGRCCGRTTRRPGSRWVPC